MKKCNVFIKKEDSLDRYCSLNCSKGNCLACVMEDAKSLVFKMQQCEVGNCSDDYECDDCEYLVKFRKISSRVSSKISKAR